MGLYLGHIHSTQQPLGRLDHVISPQMNFISPRLFENGENFFFFSAVNEGYWPCRRLLAGNPRIPGHPRPIIPAVSLAPCPAAAPVRSSERLCVTSSNEPLLQPAVRTEHKFTCQGAAARGVMLHSGDPRLITEPRRESQGQTELCLRLMDFQSRTR